MSDDTNFLSRDTPESIRHVGGNIAKIDKLRRATRSICGSLLESNEGYNPQNTVECINPFVATNVGIFRILYSEINSWFMLLKDDERENVISNVDALLQYVMDNDVDECVAKIILKIYDHLQLIIAQIDRTKKTIMPYVEGVKDEVRKDFQDEMRSIEREHVTILGIFAAIVLAFVGTFTFSTSVLNNVGKTPIVELLVIAVLIVLAFCGIMSMLINFLREINGLGHNTRWWLYVMIVLIIFALGIFVGASGLLRC